jgi:hypothetical protein
MTLRDQKSTLKLGQLDSTTLFFGPPVDTVMTLGIPADQTNVSNSDLIPYTTSQKQVLLSSRARQVRYVAETNSLFYLTSHPDDPDVRWRPVQTGGLTAQSPVFQVENYTHVADEDDVASQQLLISDSQTVFGPVFQSVLAPLGARDYYEQDYLEEVFSGVAWDEAYCLHTGLLFGTIDVYVNGLCIPLVTKTLVSSSGHDVHGWYPSLVVETGVTRCFINFERPGLEHINDGDALPKILSVGDHVQAVATYFKTSS